MPGIDKAPVRVVAVTVLLVVAGAALHGYLPGGEPPPREQPSSGFGSLFAVVAMLAVSMAIIVIAIITQYRRPRASPGAGELPRERTGERRPLTWRMLLIAVAVIGGWLLLVALMSRLSMQVEIEQPPSDTSTPPSGVREPRPEQPEPPSSVFGVLAGSAMVLMMLVLTATVIVARLMRRSTPQVWPGDEYRPAAAAAGPDSLARAAEVGLAEIGDLSREPREAIIACYAAMERELENSPEVVPRESDTPSEVLARAVEHHALRADSATELVDLFEEARFSPHVMTEEHREIAVRVLRLALADLRSVA